MKKFTVWITDLFFPETTKDTVCEIHSLNIRNIYYVSLVAGITQTVSVLIFLLFNLNRLDQSDTLGAAFRVGLSVVLCAAGFIAAGRLRKNENSVKNHPIAVKFFVGGFIILLLLWSIFVSVSNYTNHQQLLTFYTVELIAVLFVKLHPVFTAATILGSYILNYNILTYCFDGEPINAYNYLMLAVMSVAGAILNYHITAKYISEKSKANMLNESLDIIAKHDSITRLQNRYALNQRVPDYLGQDICIAMGDINSFKSVNDTYGHRAGDDALKQFSDILRDVFSDENVYRFGGDEFLIIEPGADLDAFRKKLDGVNERFFEADIPQIKTKMGCSFGCVTVCPQTPLSFFEHLARADKLLYFEKNKSHSNR